MKILCRWLLKLSGWRLDDKPLPMGNKAVLIFAPHTSNWDFVTMLMAKFAWGFKVKYLGKHSLFCWPYGWFFRALGGIPVVRHESHDIVDQVVQLITDNKAIYLAISPEGTRSFTPYWKTGFYHIALRAKLPVVLFYLDNKTRTIGFSDLYQVSGDINVDMDKFKKYYADKEGFNPEKASIVQTKKKYLQTRQKNADNDK